MILCRCHDLPVIVTHVIEASGHLSVNNQERLLNWRWNTARAKLHFGVVIMSLPALVMAACAHPEMEKPQGAMS